VAEASFLGIIHNEMDISKKSGGLLYTTDLCKTQENKSAAMHILKMLNTMTDLILNALIYHFNTYKY
jgi:hypothetical protein